jgi:pyroglutamyl-peptidase
MEATAPPTSSSAASSRVRLLLTGFSSFQGVSVNPSEQLVKEHLLPALRSRGLHVLATRIVQVSRRGANEALDELYALVESLPSDHADIVVVHLGVAAGNEAIELEQFAYNNCTFRVPDESGEQPCAECIDASLPLSHALCTSLPISALAASLRETHADAVALSDDPGLFLCNYIYFASLQRSQAVRRPRVHSLFIHVPLASAIPLNDMCNILCDFFLLVDERLRNPPVAALEGVSSQLSAMSERSRNAKSGQVA